MQISSDLGAVLDQLVLFHYVQYRQARRAGQRVTHIRKAVDKSLTGREWLVHFVAYSYRAHRHVKTGDAFRSSHYVRLNPEVLHREPAARAAKTSHYFVGDQ